MREYSIISTDSHLEVPPYVWEPYVDAEFQGVRAESGTAAGGGDAWAMPGRADPVPLGLNFSAGRGWRT